MPSNTEPTALFIQQVKDALAAVYNLPALQRSPLAGRWTSGGSDAPTAGQQLRRVLLAGIETLNPGATVPFRAVAARPYHLLHLHYVEGLPVQETGRELGLSERQTYRDLRQAEETLAVVLWPEWQAAARVGPVSPPVRAVELTAAHEEMARLALRLEPLDLLSVAQEALSAIERLAASRQVELHAVAAGTLPRVTADRSLARQVFVSLVSHAVQHAPPGTITVALAVSGAGVETQIGVPVGTPAPAAIAGQLAERLGWQLVSAPEAIILHASSMHGATVLVIDDNEGLVNLLEHYLADEGLLVRTARDGEQGLQLARSLRPQAIVLDVMMPGVDGWQVLQRLRIDPATSTIPIIVCSFIHDPGLAASLGASAFLAKPVRRDEVLAALQQVLQPEPPAG